MRPSFPRCLLFAALALTVFATVPSEATLYVRVADDVLVGQAHSIVEGRIVGSDPRAGGDAPVTLYSLEVDRVLAGEPGASNLVVRVNEGITSSGQALHLFGAPRFAADDAVVLFLARRNDGTFQVLHFQQGAFRVHTLDSGRKVLWRDFSEGSELTLAGAKSLHPEGPRDLELFRSWIVDRATGIDRAPDYFVDVEIPRPVEDGDKFTFILSSNNGLAFRWREFDTGGTVRWRTHVGGQPGLPGGGVAEVQQALNLWTNENRTPIRYFYGGTTGASAGFTGFDGVNTVLYDDPNGNFDSPFNCFTGGVLAAAGPWSALVPHTFRGQTFNTISGADMVTNKGISCLIDTLGYAPEVFAHEFGHTLGLGHSCGDSFSGPCNTFAKDDALMRASAHGDGRGARLGSDDLAGIRSLYEQANQAPNSPGNLQANPTGPGTVNLSWNDNSGNESAFEIERDVDFGDGLIQYEPVGAVGANVRTFEDSTAISGRLHTYRVRAVAGNLTSGYSNLATTTPPGDVAPSDLKAQAFSTTGVRLTWVDDAASEDNYEVESRPVIDDGAGGDLGTDDDFELVATLDPDSTTFDVEGLDVGTEYVFRIRTVGGPAGDSSYTRSDRVRTFVAEPVVCAEDSETMCLNGERFRVTLAWRDFENDAGEGNVVNLGDVTSDDSGLLYFFTASNWEMLVKVIDGCGFNDHFWVFAAATTDVEYELTVTDTLSGFTQTYSNPLGVAAPALTDTFAFATCEAADPGAGTQTASPTKVAQQVEDFLGGVEKLDGPPVSRDGADKADKMVPCDAAGDDTILCLRGDRFQLELDWMNFEGETGEGHTVPVDSNDSGLLWFFDADNWEMLVKVINGCNFNGHYWVFAAATTNVEYTLDVTDTEAETTVTYVNELGNAADALTDTFAFATCP